ncbi:MAG: Gfo/Idh/MocA family oxidoreductase [Planctomycetes bacterium]|nr:Gfo/Idh/MocA family oxidoreductase [Planctomycetota bacterium]
MAPSTPRPVTRTLPSRRRFLRGVATAAALAGLPVPCSFRRARAGASSSLRLGLIGCGGRGRQLLEVFGSFGGVEVPVVSDVNAPRMELAAKVLVSKGRPEPAEAQDHRRILDRKDIDAVAIATCEHWHGIPFIEACLARKHVFVEKPLSHTVREGRAMVEGARKAGIVALMGTQQRAGEHFQRAAEIVRSGRIGRVGKVECWNYHDARPRGGRPPDAPAPAGLDWNRWLGPARSVPFNPLRIPYSWWFDYGGGMVTNWAVHHVDTILWAMAAGSGSRGAAPALAPTSASCTGGLLATDTASDAPDTVEATWELPGWVLSYSYCGYSNVHRVPSRPHHHGILFTGDRGSLLLDREGYEVFDSASPRKPTERAGKSPQDGPWQRHFVDCVVDGKEQAVSLEESHRATLVCLLGNIAYHTRRRIPWDAAMETIPGDAEAAAMLSRPRRKGFELPAS